MTRPVAFDMTRLFLGPLARAPRGIDRVDLALARHLFTDTASTNCGILPSWRGARVFPAGPMRALLDHVEAIWAEADDVAARAAAELARLIADFAAPVHLPRAAARSRPGLGLGARARRMRAVLGVLRRAGGGQSAIRGVPPRAIYLNVGQIGLAVPPFFTWLDHRRDLTTAIMLHDVIPLEYPEMVRPGHARHHERMIRTAARHADCLIFATAHARDTVCREIARHARRTVPSLVRTLPLAAAFAEAVNPLPELAGYGYFLVVSTIEPRKNHRMLLRVWQRLVARHGSAAPHLVMVGARGFDAEAILAPIDTDPQLRARVHEVSGLSTPALAALMLGARALLSPSLAEGFGLPVLEANLLGVPTIASSIAAHREVADARTVLLAGDDEAAWEAAILACPDAPARRVPQIDERAGEAAYHADVIGFVQTIAAGGAA